MATLTHSDKDRLFVPFNRLRQVLFDNITEYKEGKYVKWEGQAQITEAKRLIYEMLNILETIEFSEVAEGKE